MLSLSEFKKKFLCSIGCEVGLIFLLLHIVCGVYGVDQVIKENKEYFLKTGETADFECANKIDIHPLKYNAEGAEEPDTSVTVHTTTEAGKVNKWTCTDEYGKSLLKTKNRKSHEALEYGSAFQKFKCASDEATNATIYCEIPEHKPTVPAGSTVPPSAEPVPPKPKNSAILTTQRSSTFFYGMLAILFFYFLQ